MLDVTEDIELIERLEDEKDKIKLYEILQIRNKIESNPDYLTIAKSIPENDEWAIAIMSLPIIWFTRPRREWQFRKAVQLLTSKYSL